MTAVFASEDSGGASFNNRPVTSATKDVPASCAPAAKGAWAPYASRPSRVNVRSGALPPEQQEISEPVPERSRRAIAAIAPRNVFDAGKMAALGDEDWIRLSEPVDYSTIKFETEVYRSGKKHIKKTRYKDNPWGKVVGQHDGAQFYTIGQRKGLNIGGHKDSIFVIATDVNSNTIYVGEGHSHKGLSRSCIRIASEDIHWIRQDLEMADGEVRRYRVRVRYRQPLQDAWLIKRPSGIFILFDTPQRGISAGQFAAWYSDDDEMLGSGVY